MEETPEVLCVCGNPIALASTVYDDDSPEPWWCHITPGPDCKNAIPAAGMPTAKDRKVLTEQLIETNAGLKQAGEQMAEIRAKLTDVDNSMQRMAYELVKPSTVRRATLNQVWDKLVDEGHMAAASIVMKMIRRVVD